MEDDGFVFNEATGNWDKAVSEIKAGGDWLDTLFKEVLGPLSARIKALEDKPQISFGGPWKEGQSYPELCLCQWQGSLWLSKAPNNTTKPGTGVAWRLAVKRGSAGRTSNE